jgi:hypothetical protein
MEEAPVRMAVPTRGGGRAWRWKWWKWGRERAREALLPDGNKYAGAILTGGYARRRSGGVIVGRRRHSTVRTVYQTDNARREKNEGETGIVLCDKKKCPNFDVLPRIAQK